MQDAKKKRGKLSDVQKRELCRFKMTNPEASSRTVVKYIEAKVGITIGQTTVYDILKRRDMWLNLPEEHPKYEYARQRHPPKHEKMETKLFQWVGEVSSKNIPISERMIVNEARHLGKEMGIVDFTYSAGWLSRFKKRYKTKELGYNLDAGIAVIKNVDHIPTEVKKQTGIFTVIYKGTKYRTRNVSQIPVSLQAPEESSDADEMSQISATPEKSSDADEMSQISATSQAPEKSSSADEMESEDINNDSGPEVEICAASWTKDKEANPGSLIDDPVEDIKPNINLLNEHIQKFAGDVMQSSSRDPFNFDLAVRRKKTSRPVHCEVCGLRLNTKGIYERHMVIHTGEKPHVCTVCGKGFTQDDSLKIHMNIHTGDRRFLCLVCKKMFAYRTSLHSHMRVHSGEKPFSCKLCDKSFSQKNSLDKHMSIHSGKKPFQCSVCDKTFAMKFYLKCHMRIHTGEKPYECQICQKTFTQRGSLNLHLRMHDKTV